MLVGVEISSQSVPSSLSFLLRKSASKVFLLPGDFGSEGLEEVDTFFLPFLFLVSHCRTAGRLIGNLGPDELLVGFEILKYSMKMRYLHSRNIRNGCLPTKRVSEAWWDNFLSLVSSGVREGEVAKD